MINVPRPEFKFLRCSLCKGDLRFQGESLICDRCKTRYDIEEYVPDMLPPKIRHISSEVDKFNDSPSKFPVTQAELKSAGAWLAEQIKVDEGDIDWGKRDGFRNQLAFALRLCDKMKLSYEEKKLVVGMLGARNMSCEYKNHIADQLSASGEASGYEAYEDILLRRQVDEIVGRGDTILIEIGSGVGRLLHQYGTCISKRLSPSGSRYRRFARSLYSYKSEYDKQLKLILGLDFERKMINESMLWLKSSGLEHLLQQHRIMQIRALTTRLYINLDTKPHKVVTILFQTLGNQLEKALQIRMLEKAKEFASPNGTVFVSVFNEKSFDEQAETYYRSIEASVGKIAYCKNGVFLSDRGVVSLWFDADQVKRLFEKAGMRRLEILSNEDLETFPEYDRYIEVTDQKRFKKRAIIAIATIKNGS